MEWLDAHNYVNYISNFLSSEFKVSTVGWISYELLAYTYNGNRSFYTVVILLLTWPTLLQSALFSQNFQPY